MRGTLALATAGYSGKALATGAAALAGLAPVPGTSNESNCHATQDGTLGGTAPRPLTRDAAFDCAAATLGAVLDGPVATLAHAESVLRGATPASPCSTSQVSAYCSPPAGVSAAAPAPRAAAHVCAAFAHALWAVPGHLQPQLAARVRALLTALQSSKHWQIAQQTPALMPVTALSRMLDAPVMQNPGSGRATDKDHRSHELQVLLFEAHRQAALLADAAAAAAIGAVPQSALELAGAHVAGRSGLESSPHMAALVEVCGLVGSWAALAVDLLQQLGAGQVGDEPEIDSQLPEAVRGMLVQTAVLLHALHPAPLPTDAEAAHNALCTPSGVPQWLPRVAHAVHGFGERWGALQGVAALQSVSDKVAAVSVALAAAGRALGVEWPAPAALALRDRLWPPLRPRPPARHATLWRSLLGARLSADAEQLQHGLACRSDDVPDGGVEADERVRTLEVRTNADVDMRGRLARALALCLCEAVSTGGLAAESAEVLGAVQQALSDRAAGISNRSVGKRAHARAFAVGATLIAASADSTAANKAACAHTHLASTGSAIAAALCAATATAAGSCAAAPPCEVISRGAAAAAAAPAQPLALASLLQVVAWSVDTQQPVPESVLMYARAHWHAHATASHCDAVASRASSVPAMLPAGLARTAALAPAAADALGARIAALGAPGRAHTASFTLRVAPVATQFALPLSDLPVRIAQLKQTVHAVIAQHAVATSAPTPLQQELSLLAALAAHTLAAFAPACDEGADAPVAAQLAAMFAAASAARGDALASAAAACIDLAHAVEPALTHLQLPCLNGVAELCQKLAAQLVEAAQHTEGMDSSADLAHLAAAGAAWVALGALRAQLLLPPRMLDPACASSEAAATLQHEADHLTQPALAAARAVAAQPLLPRHDAVLAALRQRLAGTAHAVAELSKRGFRRDAPARYAAVAADAHMFVQTVLLPAADPAHVSALRSAATGAATASVDTAPVAEARTRAGVLAQWCDDAARDEDYSDVLTPVATAARDMQRGLLLLCAAAEMQRARDAFAAVRMRADACAAELLSYPQELSQLPHCGSKPPDASSALVTTESAQSPAHPAFEQQIALLAKLAAEAILLDATAEQRASIAHHFRSEGRIQHLRESCARAARCPIVDEGGGHRGVAALFEGLGGMAKAMGEAQEAAKAAEAAKEALFKQKDSRCACPASACPCGHSSDSGPQTCVVFL
jgi:hypothetical protein